MDAPKYVYLISLAGAFLIGVGIGALVFRTPPPENLSKIDLAPSHASTASILVRAPLPPIPSLDDPTCARICRCAQFAEMWYAHPTVRDCEGDVERDDDGVRREYRSGRWIPAPLAEPQDQFE